MELYTEAPLTISVQRWQGGNMTEWWWNQYGDLPWTVTHAWSGGRPWHDRVSDP